jgi:hypothetical protein
MAAPESMIMMSAASTSSPYSSHVRDLQEDNSAMSGIVVSTLRAIPVL